MNETKSKIGEYLDWTRGEDEALLNMLGGTEVARKLLEGEFKFSITDDVAKIVVAIQKLFDKNGRRIPFNLKASVCSPDKDYFVKQPYVSYPQRLYKGFTNTGLNAFMSLGDFSDKAEKLLNQLRRSEQLKNLLKGPYLPIIIPKTNLIDLGAMTAELVTAAGKSYQNHFTKLFGKQRSFNNYRKDELEGHVTIVDGSRYEQLVEGIKKESVVVIYFPTVLQGYSVNAQREQMTTLPKGLILSGPLDVAMAFAMYPDVLGRDDKTPGYDCSAVNWQSSDYSLSFGARDDYADFGRGGNLSLALDGYSGGLLFVG